ncbi:MAG TPA: lamin tail domain-containing protein [Candidatus Paceibacterota bacterium]|nr:lamin tail domain-containing protein [Verrucomicrobiota bacterium]HRZ43652.1 lamin tail domain-containing protein [Candidatus Paceibacterota bacterium]
MRRWIILSLGIALAGAAGAHGFVAYNDHVAGPGTHSNATLYAANTLASGPMKNIETGASLSGRLKTVAVAVNYATQTGVPAPGTDAAEAFGGYVDFTARSQQSIELTVSSSYTLEFTGLDPSRRYDFTGTAVRGVDTYANRWTLVTVEGAALATPVHSAGIGVVTEGLWATQAALWTGANHRSDQGWVVRWTDIDPGPDGAFKVISQLYRGPTPGVGTGDSTAGAKGYALTGIRLIESAVAGRPSIENGPAEEVASRSARLGGRVTDPGIEPPEVTLYYGPADGGKTAAAWERSAVLGVQTGPFSVRVDGLAPGTEHFFRSFASNRVAGAWAESSGSFTTALEPPEIADRGVADRFAFSVTVQGEVVSTGGDAPAVLLFWGSEDGGQNPLAWAAQTNAGTVSGVFPVTVGGLEPATTYFYRFQATNRAGASWSAAAGQWTTDALSMPEAILDPVRGISDRSAVVSGQVTQTGGDPPAIELFFGTADRGASALAWERTLPLGTQSGLWRASLAPLAPSTLYYVRARARNAAGEAWSDAQSFLTLAVLPISAVINEIHYHTSDKTSLSEFVELHNASEGMLDLSGWRMRGAVDFDFPPGATLAPGEYWVVAEDPADFQAAFGMAAHGYWLPGDKLPNEGGRVELQDAAGITVDEVTYQSGFPWPNRANGEGASMELIHPLLDNDLGGAWRSSVAGPTPGRRNSAYAEAEPPQLRQAAHTPAQPRSGQEVAITVKGTDEDGVAEVTLTYQIVEPGGYISRNDTRYVADWTSIPMRDDGQAGDQVSGDSIFTCVLPAGIQSHRRLVRYRIMAADSLGNIVRAPYPEDPSPNFAYFVYDGVPPWTGAAQPGVTAPATYSPELLSRIPVYHLITTRKSHEEAMSIPSSQAGQYWGDEYPWWGTLVYDGEVYDHIRFRARGGVWRYSMGKNMWKFDFNTSHDFQARDDYGQPYATRWRKLNFSALIQQGNFLQRGEQGLFEGASFRLHNLAGNPSPLTHYVHFRIVEQALESGATGSQYDTDFQGLYMAIEQPDGRFLDEHGLPDANLYKMEGGTGELNNQGPTQPSNKSDLNAFLAYTSGTQPQSWWTENLELDQYYRFRSILMAIHDYDSHAGKNYFYYHHPETGRWWVINWDLDLTWTTTYNGGNGRDPLNEYVLVHPPFAIDFRNRLREIRDLLFNPEQAGMVLDEIARVVYQPGQPSLVDADRAMWDYNPILASTYINASKAGQGRYYESASPRTFAGMLQKQKDYVVSRGQWLDANLLTDESLAPQRPTVSALNPEFPLDDLRFDTTPFASPAGQPFAGIEWRLAAVTDPAQTNLLAGAHRPRYEIQAAWTSGVLSPFQNRIQIPAGIARIGDLCRVRARMKDAAGRWSHWSAPVQFTASAPLAWARLESDLALTEIMYHPPPCTAAEAAAGFEESDFEFIELWNRGGQALDLSVVRFTKGIDFDFASGPITSLAPGAYALVVRREAAFVARYGPGLPVAGEYHLHAGEDQLANGGERLKLSYGAGNALADFDYDDDPPWPIVADGEGYSLALASPAGAIDYSRPESWKPSAAWGGTPGAPDRLALAEWKSAFFTGEEIGDPAVAGDDADPDGDGAANALEYVAGTHPRDKESVLRLEAAVEGIAGGTLLEWRAVRGKRYQLQYRDSFGAGAWLDLPQGGWAAFMDEAAAVVDPQPRDGQRFYRVIVAE